MDERNKNFGLIERAKRRATNTVTAVYGTGEQFRVVCDTHHFSTVRALRKDAFRIARDPSLFCERCAESTAPRRVQTEIEPSRRAFCALGDHFAVAAVTTYRHEDGGESLDACAKCAQTKRGRQRLAELNAELKQARREKWNGPSERERQNAKRRILSRGERATARAEYAA